MGAWWASRVFPRVSTGGRTFKLCGTRPGLGEGSPQLPSSEVDGMTQFTRGMIAFLRSEDGPTAVEYAVMLALIIVVCLAAIQFVGTSASVTFSTVGKAIDDANS